MHSLISLPIGNKFGPYRIRMVPEKSRYSDPVGLYSAVIRGPIPSY